MKKKSLCWISNNQFLPLKFMSTEHLINARNLLQRTELKQDGDIFGSMLTKAEFLKEIDTQIELREKISAVILNRVQKKIGCQNIGGSSRIIRLSNILKDIKT